MPTLNPSDYVDTLSYPIDHPTSEHYASLLESIQADLRANGCAVLKNFIPKKRLEPLLSEAKNAAANAHRSFNRANVYFSHGDPNLTRRHPVRRFFDRSNALIPADQFDDQSLLRTLYKWPPFGRFLQAALDEANFFPYADPLADLIVNVVEPGCGFPWHFDTNNYTVTLALQNGDAGGQFQYSPNIRSTADENYAGVQQVLDGTMTAVETLELNPGDLQIFKGRYTLHRVTSVQGRQNRYVAIFSFADRPDMVASVARCRHLYGRVTPVHLELDRQRSDSLLD